MKIKLDKLGKVKLSESQIQRQCIEYLRADGWIVRPAPRSGHKATRGAFSVPTGEPDLIAVKRYIQRGTGILPRREFWDVLLVECKEAKGQLRHTQVAWQLDAALRGMQTHVIRSLDDLKSILEGRRAA